MSTGRFAALELLALTRPPALASMRYEEILEAARTRLIADFARIGITYDVGGLETDPAIVVTQGLTYRELLTRVAIDDAVANSYLGSAIGAGLDARCADYGVVRRTLPHDIAQAAPANRPPSVPAPWIWDATRSLWVEHDDSLRLRGRLAWEALSVAGPAGAYVFHAHDASPGVRAAVAYGPESGYVDPGEVLVVIQSYGGVPSNAIMDAVAARLDAAQVIYASGAEVARPVRDEQSVRPLGARVIVHAGALVEASVAATLYIRPGSDPEAIRITARARLDAYLAKRRGIGLEVPRSAIIAAVHIADAEGLPVVEEVHPAQPVADLIPTHLEVIDVTSIALTVEVR